MNYTLYAYKDKDDFNGSKWHYSTKSQAMSAASFKASNKYASLQALLFIVEASPMGVNVIKIKTPNWCGLY